MNGSTRPRVKICCIGSIEEARLAVQEGADAIGLVSEMPSGPGVIPESRIAEIAAVVPPGVASFLLTSHRSAAAIIEQQRRLRVNALQLCDRLETDGYRALRAALPGIPLVQVIHVTGEEALSEAARIAPLVDGLLLDSGNQSLPVKVLGGTGGVHDWRISRRIRQEVDVPVYLAGGLCAENVSEAILTVGPFGVDVCSGVRTNGQLDPVKLTAFLVAVKGAARHQSKSEAEHGLETA